MKGKEKPQGHFLHGWLAQQWHQQGSLSFWVSRGSCKAVHFCSSDSRCGNHFIQLLNSGFPHFSITFSSSQTLMPIPHIKFLLEHIYCFSSWSYLNCYLPYFLSLEGYGRLQLATMMCHLQTLHSLYPWFRSAPVCLLLLYAAAVLPLYLAGCLSFPPWHCKSYFSISMIHGWASFHSSLNDGPVKPNLTMCCTVADAAELC